MLYLLGGASRAGKSKLSRKMLMERRVPPFSLDILMMGLVNGMPQFGLDALASAIVRGEMLWPLVRAMAVNVVETGVALLLEGDILLPKHVAELSQCYGAEVRACFLGYTSVSPARKLQDIRALGGEPNDWLQDASDDEVLALIAEMVHFSSYLKRECDLHHVRYFDGSADFLGALDGAYCYLTAP
jgi:hypothetical protein